MSETGTTGLSVLVIDDDEVMRELLSALLEAAGYSVVTADSPAVGLSRLRGAEGASDIVLTDLRMPDTDTVALLRELRGIRPSTIRILGMSGSDAEPAELEQLDGFLLKPFSVEDFTAAVERAQAGEAQAAAPVQQPSPKRHAPVLDDGVYAQMAKSLPAKALRELYELTLDDVRKRTDAIRAAAASGDSATCRSEAHAIKGGCGMVGAMELRAIAADIETGSPVDNTVLDEIDSAAARLRRMLNKLT